MQVADYIGIIKVLLYCSNNSAELTTRCEKESTNLTSFICRIACC